MADPFRLETVWLDLPGVAGGFGRRLRDAGLPTGVDRATQFARALTLVRPVSRRRLYWTARAVFVSDPAHVAPFDAVFAAVFGGDPRRTGALDDKFDVRAVQSTPADDDRPVGHREPDGSQRVGEDATSIAAQAPRAASGEETELEIPVPVAPSDEEVLRGKSFEALEPGELAALYPAAANATGPARPSRGAGRPSSDPAREPAHRR